MTVTKVGSTNKSINDFEREEDRAIVKQPVTPEPEVDRPGSMDGRELLVNNERGQESTEGGPRRGTPWGFVLVLAAIVVVAIVYSVTIFAIDQKDRTPEIVFGAMAAAFTVIGTLVGTYFGIKAGLDGQDKVKETLAGAVGRSRERPQGSTERGDEDGRRRVQSAEEQQRATRELQELRRGEHEERQGWDGGGV
jgi:hypothetical protein